MIILGVLLDLLVGDPENFFHPVRLMGRIIELEEGLLRRVFSSARGLRLAGLIMVITNVFLGLIFSQGVLKLLGGGVIYRIYYVYLVFTSLAARNLRDEAMKVYRALGIGLDKARHRLSFIVGRDTRKLSEEGVVRACVETVAENSSEGIIAPLFYLLIFGPAGGLVYKFINTMDSMVAYKNDRYIDLGYYPAKLDDLVNFIPARLTGLLMIASSLGSFSASRGFKVMLRDRKNHDSPNAAYPEAAVAGLLGISLGGPSYYGGQLVSKKSLGDDLNRPQKEHIRKAIKIMFRSEFLMLASYLALNYLVGRTI